jgi:hypothetical protein
MEIGVVISSDVYTWKNVIAYSAAHSKEKYPQGIVQ